MQKLLKNLLGLDKSVLGINERNIEIINRYNKRSDYQLADDKALAKAIFEKNQISCPKTYGVVNYLTEVLAVWKQVSVNDQLVIKPAKGAGGKGIMILNKREGQWFSGSKPVTEEQITYHIANILFGLYSFGDSDKALFEEFVNPHPFFASIYGDGVPDFRIILLKARPLQAMLRMPTERSNGKANLHQGGLGIGVDMERGTLKMAYDGKRYHKVHPDSGNPINGLAIPCWKEMLALSIQTAKAFPLQYLGIDLVIDRDKGPMVMEVNVRPGLGIQLANRQGLKTIVKHKTETYDNQ